MGMGGCVSIYSTKILQRKSEILEGLGILALWSVRSYFAGQLSWGGAGCPASFWNSLWSTQLSAGVKHRILPEICLDEAFQHSQGLFCIFFVYGSIYNSLYMARQSASCGVVMTCALCGFPVAIDSFLCRPRKVLLPAGSMPRHLFSL